MKNSPFSLERGKGIRKSQRACLWSIPGRAGR